ncbi:hypothetical protein HY837_01115 [archaeon]|nr:hypothetical protein [archaeon]
MIVIQWLYIVAIEVKIKKWGNSMGVILPKELVKEKKLKENQKILIQIVEKADLSDIFGSLKFKKSAQELKDEAREGWD